MPPGRSVLLVPALLAMLVGCQDDGSTASGPVRTGEPAEGAVPTPHAAPPDCVAAQEADRGDLAGEPTWVRFCPGPDGLTAPAEVPSDALTTHLDLLSGLTAAVGDPGLDCRRGFSRTYRLQIGYDDGEVAQVSGPTGPTCLGTLRGAGWSVGGPDRLGVYGVVMAAYGRQYADGFDASAPGDPMTCPEDPQRPDSVDRDGASTALETGYRYGRPDPMVMPLTAVRGILCTWSFGAAEPVVRDLSAEEAERVRIGMHAIYGAMVDCGMSRGPTHTAVVEDETGTRRAVTIVESQCSTVIRSDDGYGLGFPWLDQ
ncbi:hypothetical protein [Nocardioides stalactiti]|uniref:hypothetical protein n=1 Tax=Nocardioides stalactiti TaxID=2755356 RepID=UPI0015FF839A|nr:hypothetical protein [Nocardioides stalactiti]